MATTRSLLLDASVRHAVFVQRYAGSQTKEATVFLERARRAVTNILSEESITELTRSRYQKTLREIDAELQNIYDDMADALTDNLQDFSEYEAGFSARMLEKTTDVDIATVTSPRIRSAIVNRKILLVDQEMTLAASFKAFSRLKRKEVINRISTGILAGNTNQEIIKDTKNMMSTLHWHQVSALVHTTVVQASNLAREMTIQANDDIIDRVQWVSTLDGKTTATCQSLDGKIFEKGVGPRPPIHFNCRSTVIPLVKEEFRILKDGDSTRPAVTDKGAEQVDSRTTYNSWLKRQPKGFQEEVLGEQRMKLFRDGKLSLDSFVDENYVPLTLDELKRKEPKAFERAGLVDTN